MHEWRWSPLNGVARIAKGRVLPASNLRRDSSVRYLGAVDLEGGCSGLYVPVENAVLCEEDDVLMLWDGERSGLTGCDLSGAVSSTVARIRPIRTKMEGKYLYHHLNSRYMEIQSIRTGTGVPHVPRDLQTFVKVPVPPLEEQRRIAEILDTIDEAIQATERVIAKLDTISRALDEASLSGLRTEDTIRLGDECRVLGGKRLPAGHSYSAMKTPYCYLRVVDFYRRNVNYESLVALSESTFQALSRYEIRPGELFISVAGSIGHVGVNQPPTGMRTILTENAARIVPSGSLDPGFLALQMNSHVVKGQVSAEIGTGGGVPKLALHRVANIRVTCPDIRIQKEVAQRHEVGRAARDSETRKLDKLRKLRIGLAADLLSGRVRTVAS